MVECANIRAGAVCYWFIIFSLQVSVVLAQSQISFSKTIHTRLQIVATGEDATLPGSLTYVFVDDKDVIHISTAPSPVRLPLLLSHVVKKNAKVCEKNKQTTINQNKPNKSPKQQNNN